jgi:tetrapyrrole methylase family protein/MazG family protein
MLLVKKKYTMEELKNIIAELRGENGCPWDKKQTHETLIEYLIEESYEVIDAIKQQDVKGLCEELGDVLLQVVLHSQIASENGEFTLEDVISVVSNKMIERHPHVFGDFKPKNEEDLKQNWEKIKREEKGYRSTKEILSKIPDCLPAL